MSKTFRSCDGDQDWLLPRSLHEFVPADYGAHFIRDLVRDELDLTAILSSYNEERGFPPYHPGMMVAMLLYAYTQGVYSSRRIARCCEVRLEPSCAGSRSRCAIWNGCWAEKPWRSRSSKRHSSSHGQKTDLAVQLCAADASDEAAHRYARPCSLEHCRPVKGVRPKRGPQTRDGDLELTAAIRRFVDMGPDPGLRGKYILYCAS
jgi:hypothetical protein